MAEENLSPREAFDRIDEALRRNAFEDAFEFAKPWAELGYGWAEACIGSLHQCGLGTARNREAAIRFFERAAEHGFAGAWHSLGVIYATGDESVPPDTERASEHYEKARQMGYVPGKPYEF